MTALEKVKLEHPEIPEKDCTSLNGRYCPSDFGYIADPETCFETGCEDCWDREIPEEKEENKMIYAHIGPAVAEVEELTATDEGVTAKARILDSGNRRQFESGAVRDIQEGKGRCDLLPLDVVATHLCSQIDTDVIVKSIYKFQETSDVSYLYHALAFFEENFDDGKTKNGAIEIASQRRCTMILQVAIHFEEGAKKYGENNWQKGIPVHCYIDSAVRHYLKFLRGDKDEPHDRAFCWNILCAIWTCKHKPELNEYAVKEEK